MSEFAIVLYFMMALSLGVGFIFGWVLREKIGGGDE